MTRSALIAVAVLGAVLLAVVMARRDGASSGEHLDTVAACLKARSVPVAIVKSSTGQRQLAVAHGSAPAGGKVTLVSSKSYVAGDPMQSGGTRVTFGATASRAERDAILACL